MQPLALEAVALAFGWPQENGAEKEEKQECLTYMLRGIGFRADSLADA